MDPLNEPSISPYKVRSITKALALTGVDTATKGAASSSASIDKKLDTVISLLQQLVDK